MTARTSRAGRGGGSREQATDELSTVFPSVAPSAASARRFVAAALRRWECSDDFIELVLLLTSELVTNEYRHAGTETRVSVRLDDLTLETEEATYDHARDLITAAGPVTVRGRQLDLRGLGMEVKVGPQHVRFLRDVHTIVHSDAAAS